MDCIMLIDDDYISNFLNKRLVEKLDVSKEIKVMQNGEEALDFVKGLGRKKKQGPDLILLDINMPIMDGIEFLHAYETLSLPEKEKTRIIVLTTSTLEQDYVESQKFGITNYMTKPLTEEKLAALIGSMD